VPVTGKCVVAQSGGPTAVINSSAAGVIQEALAHRCITGVYGAHNGILGVLLEDLFDLGAEKPETIEALRRTPAAALGSCRYKIKSLQDDRADYDRILEVFKLHDVHYFFYIGGNDSMDTAAKLGQLAREQDYELVVMGVPKTIDNDLAFTDHTPGYGSVAKYVATSVMEAGRDTEALATTDTCTVVEVMGRHAGWIAAAAGLARREEEDAPHLIYVPEAPTAEEKLLEDVNAALQRFGRCVIAVSEGMVNEKGELFASLGQGKFGRDAFGHVQLGGVGEAVRQLVEARVGIKCRSTKLGTCQREAIHFASLTDATEAYEVGRAAVRHAVDGVSGQMVTLVRESDDPYTCATGLQPLAEVANAEKKLPPEMIDDNGSFITEAFRKYAGPLIRGEVPVEIGPDGLPVYARLDKHSVARLSKAEHQLHK